MPSLCIVPWCKAKRVKGIKFYKFPRQAGHRDQWLLALELDPKDVLNYKDPRVCPKHFPASAFSDTGRRQLPTSSTPVGNFTNGRNTQTRTQNLLGMMDPLQTETDEPLEIPNFVHADQALVRSFTLKEEESVDPLQIKNNEPLQVSNYSHPFYGLDTPKSGSGNSFQDLVGSSNEEEIVDPLQINNDEPMQFSNFSHSSYGSDNSKSSSWNSDNSKSSSCSTSQALVGSFILSEEGSFRNGCFQKKRIGLQDFLSTGETIWLASGSNSSKLDEKIYLKTTVEIEKLTKLTIEENCCGKWRCSACGKIENTFYFLQLHKSTNCETGLSFICEICREEINNYSDFAIHYIKHEADKEKKCPICLCPNVNNIKEHLIMRKHVSEDINGFKCTDNECKNSNEKAKLEAIFNSTINGYCQDFQVNSLSKKSEKKAKKEHLSIVESTPDVQEKPNLRQRKENTVYIESSNSDIDDISDEGLQIHNQGVHKVISLDEAGTKNVPYDEGQVHLDVDNSLREFACSECSDLFSTHSQLIRHLKLHKKVGIAAVTEPSKNLNDESASNLMSSYHGDSTNHNSNERTTVGKNSEFREKLSTSPLIEAIHLYECGLCGKTFKDRKYFVRHLRTQHKQTESDLYECESCGKTFKDRKYFLRHLRTQHKQTENDKEDEMHECPFCQTKFEKKYHLCRHLMTHRDGSELKCNKCSESFSWPFELVTHLKMHKKTEIAGSMQPLDNSDAEPTSNSEPVTNNIAKESNFNECGICKKTYVNRRSLLRHLGRHVKGRTYLCNICGLSFFRANALNLHIQRHTGDKNFTCDKCGKNFYSMSLLNQHLKKHAAEESKQILEKLFECEICHKKFETKQIYSQHMKRHTEGKTQECGICQRKCYTKYQLAAHMRIHTGEKPYECKICNSTFAQRTNLKIHMRSHSEEKPYSCEFCSKSFKDKPAFKDHVNMHTGKKPYKCKQCDKTFTARKRLVAHKRSHSGGKKYSCDICNEVFAYANYRNLHMALHENPNPFGCEFCSKKFNYKKNLVLHVQRMHSSHNPFKCKLCGKTFDTSNKIETHIINRICGKKAMSLDNIKSQSTYHKELSNADGCSDACHLSEGIRSASTLSGNSDTLGLKKEKLFICNMCDQEYESVLEIANHYDFLHRKSQ
ncbi:hypothetical protein QYM36_011508 [Artemia franciscana]|uniref:Uncharacterized protein n=1 Tax=Artemia franciscana TaxID=6661 RepID=A0AA88HVC8_ARTSF|nr:hypothetical protein QYM36_011508 [Artemia franciscana]